MAAPKKIFRRDYSHDFVHVQPRTWNDPRFRKLSRPLPSARELYFFLLTCPLRIAVAGVVKAGRATIADELEWEAADVSRCFDEIADAGLAVADWGARIVYLTEALRQDENCPTSPNQAVRWRREINSLPDCDLKQRIDRDLQAALRARAQGLLRFFMSGAGPSTARPDDVIQLAITDAKSDGITSTKADAKAYGITDGIAYKDRIGSDRKGYVIPSVEGNDHDFDDEDPERDEKEERKDDQPLALVAPTPRSIGPSMPDLGKAKPAIEKTVKRHLAAALRVHAELDAARRRLNPRSTGLRPSYDSLAGIAGRLAAGRTVEDCLHVIAVREAECRSSADLEKSFKYFNTTTPWRPEQFEFARSCEAPAGFAAQPPPIALAAGPSLDPLARMPNGGLWPPEIDHARKKLPAGEQAAFLAKMRRTEPFRWLPDGSMAF